MTDSEKITAMLDYLQISARQFANDIGLSQVQTIYDIQHGRCKMSKAIFKRIIETYPQFNADWLLSGNGDMHTSVSNGNHSTQTIGNNNIVNTAISHSNSDLLEQIKSLRNENELLKKDIEIWKSRCESNVLIIHNQTQLIEVLQSQINQK